MRKTFRFFATCALVALSAAAAHAGTLAFTFDNSTGQGLGNGPYTLGWSFTANADIDVTALGVFDDSQNGLAESHAVGLWDSSGVLLAGASATIAAGAVDRLDSQFRMVDIPIAHLAAGSTYYIGAVWNALSSDYMIFPGYAVNFATVPEVAFGADRYVSGGSLTFPDSSAGTGIGYFGPTFEFSDTVPEPSYLVALGALGLVAAARRRLFVRGN